MIQQWPQLLISAGLNELTPARRIRMCAFGDDLTFEIKLGGNRHNRQLAYILD